MAKKDSKIDGNAGANVDKTRTINDFYTGGLALNLQQQKKYGLAGIAAASSFLPTVTKSGSENYALALAYGDYRRAAENGNPKSTGLGLRILYQGGKFQEALEASSTKEILYSQAGRNVLRDANLKAIVEAEGDTNYKDILKSLTKFGRSAQDAKTKLDRALEDADGDEAKEKVAYEEYNKEVDKFKKDIQRFQKAAETIDSVVQGRFALSESNLVALKNYAQPAVFGEEAYKEAVEKALPTREDLF